MSRDEVILTAIANQMEAIEKIQKSLRLFTKNFNDMTEDNLRMKKIDVVIFEEDK